MSSPLCMNEVTLMMLMIEIVVGNVMKVVRCLLDCGSQRSYVLQSTAETLNLKSTSSETLTHALFGGTRTESKTHKRYSIGLSPVDVGEGHPEIEILIGSDIYGQILTGEVIQLEGGLTAINTKLGWTLCGESKGTSIQSFEGTPSVLVTNLLIQDMEPSFMWKFETIGIADDAQSISRVAEDQTAKEQFLRGLRRTGDGRYCMSLPWALKFPPDIPSNWHNAEKRLFATTRKLRKLNKFDEYSTVFNESLAEDVIEIAPKSVKNDGGHYLLHHPLAAEDPVSAVLGLLWDRRDDSLTISVQREIVKRDLSKRRLLSLIHAVFDPLGNFVPVILPAKLILQEAWATKSTWDKPLPDELQTRFERWYERLPSLSSLKLPRRMGHGIRDSWTLHVFCDASQAAYATVIYLRSKEEDKVFVKFVITKSRVSPLKKITIPRLELLACVLGARLARYTVETLCLVLSRVALNFRGTAPGKDP
ncbi:uncharacterized protein LOC118197708 [Stegodyphus dumicola]|uniref:uncharacterized protein LOC118197708 n=1 Tax=Stegodyphus dumicola TaxID=202533 RepID=UPI0015AEFB65|nr:uncharacterized protein LOC118197708 [Stegodyphus dumicola]